MLPAEDLFGYVYVLIHDLMLAGAVAVPRPGPAPACSDVELLAIAEVRHPSRVRGSDQWTGPGNDLAA
jgi:hypothetical protein